MKKRGSNINPDIYHSKVPSSDVLSKQGNIQIGPKLDSSECVLDIIGSFKNKGCLNRELSKDVCGIYWYRFKSIISVSSFFFMSKDLEQRNWVLPQTLIPITMEPNNCRS